MTKLNNRISAEKIIKLLDLKELPIEGGLFRNTYASTDEISKSCLPSRYSGKKLFGSAIYYLLTANTFSAFHKLPTDEIFHFYLGDPVELFELHPEGTSSRIVLGPEIQNGQKLQHVVYRGIWQGSRLIPGGDWALLGTTMAPGFSNEDFQLGDPALLIKEYPADQNVIKGLTRKQ